MLKEEKMKERTSQGWIKLLKCHVDTDKLPDGLNSWSSYKEKA